MNYLFRILCFTAALGSGGTAGAADGPLTIAHASVDPVSVGKPIAISATVDDARDEIETVRAYFRTPQDNRYYFVAMKRTGTNRYTGVLPAPLHGTASLEYVILAKTASDQIVRTPTYVVEVNDKGVLARLE